MSKIPDIVDKLIYGNDLPTKMEQDCRHLMQPLLVEAATEIQALRREIDRLLTVIYLNRGNIDGGYEAARNPEPRQ